LILEGHIRDNRALRHAGGTVHERRVGLGDTVKMKPRGLIPKLVGQVDDDCVSDVGLNERTWPLIIDADDWAAEAVRAGPDPGDVLVVGDRGRRDARDPGQEEKQPDGRHAKARVPELCLGDVEERLHPLPQAVAPVLLEKDAKRFHDPSGDHGVGMKPGKARLVRFVGRRLVLVLGNINKICHVVCRCRNDVTKVYVVIDNNIPECGCSG
jgi:hypothetical protein